LVECSPPPFQSDNIKYVVGTPVTTVINLLDWADENSPLATSKGWVDVTANEFVTVVDEVNGIPITSNGLPMSSDFDLAVYVKGDAKSTAVFNAQLIIEYGDEVVDTDGDGVPDNADNCTLVFNPDQRDTDGDNYGNICDPDFNNDLIVNATDISYLKSNFFTNDPDADLDGDGVVNATDLAILRSFYFKPPGPSGLVP
jgi:hypothetical protein